MSAVLERIRTRASEAMARIVLPEGEDPRVREAAETMAREQLAEPVLVDRERVARECDRYVELLHERRKHKGLSLDGARDALSDPLLFAAMMAL